MKINLVYNWPFKHLVGSHIHKKQPVVQPPPPYPQKWTVKLLFKNSRIHKHMTNFKTPPRISFLCGHHRCVLPMLYGKDGPSFIKLLKSIYSSYYTIHVHETAEISWGHFYFQILVERILNFLFFLFFILFLIPSIYHWCPLLSFNLLWTYNNCWVSSGN